jgi:1-deoxy-D-xylulose 5-phosphate reductoisomerase
VGAFAAGEVAFGSIAEIVARVLSETPDEELTLPAVRAADARARERAGRIVKNSSRRPEPVLAVAK